MVLLFCILFFPAGNVKADDTLLPTAWDNRGVYPKRYSDLVSLDDGYMRVFYRENVVYIEYYDNDFNIKSKKNIPMELDLWGGFYNGSDGYYLVEGQSNGEEDDAKEVIRIIRYDKNWQKTGTGKNLPEECWRKNSRRQKLRYGRSLSETAGRTCRQKVITSNTLNGIVRKNNKKHTNHVRQDITDVLRHRPVEKGH